jgi:hypothetical protein
MASATVDGELIEEVSDMTKSLSLSNGILNISNSDLTDVESDETELDADIKKRGPGYTGIWNLTLLMRMLSNL